MGRETKDVIYCTFQETTHGKTPGSGNRDGGARERRACKTSVLETETGKDPIGIPWLARDRGAVRSE